jgi:hypothetical protein
MRKDKEITPLISSAKGNGSVRMHRPPSQEEENGFRQRRTGQVGVTVNIESCVSEKKMSFSFAK